MTIQTNNNIIHRAQLYAINAHAGQFRDGGTTPYIEHPTLVASILALVTDDKDVIAAGWLHDTIEDTDVTYDDLVETFGSRVADLVNEVTHVVHKKGNYFPRLHTREGIMIKFADNLSNLSTVPLSGWGDKRIAAFVAKSKFWKSEEAE